MKYTLAILLSVCALLTACGQKIDYAGVFEIEALDNDTVRICNSRSGYKKSAGEYHLSGVVKIPAAIYGKKVVEIGKKAFYGCSDVKEFIIPGTITTIGSYAFDDCTSLTSVVFEEPNGWKIERSYHSSTTPLTLTDPQQNANYLKDTYKSYTWQRQ